VQIIGNSAFSMSSKLTKANIPNSVEAIGTYAFRLCKELEEFKYNGKLKYIGKEAFGFTKVGNCIKNSQLPK
jgi:hypothetical protein